ncbi:MAG: asparagine synthetase A [Candidatus Heimdallarchaeota archaeon]
MKNREMMDDLYSVRFRYRTIRSLKMRCILQIQDEILSAIRDFLRREGFVEILAPIIGPITDPGIRGAKQASIDYYGTQFKIMSSMILYKQMAILSLEKVFALSPNIRLEPVEAIKTRRHLVEFRQIDVEQAYADYQKMMVLAEKLVQYVCKRVKKKCKEALNILGRKLIIPRIPFKRFSYYEAIELLKTFGFKMRLGKEIPWHLERVLSERFHEPFFVTNYPISARGFYYREDPEHPGILRDFDLMYPEGYGEAISGGEREHTYKRVLKRIKENGEKLKGYWWYLEMLKEGVPPSAGFGIGVERLTRWICGLKNIWDAVPFPKVPGVISP